jgi:hypothetical protein
MSFLLALTISLLFQEGWSWSAVSRFAVATIIFASWASTVGQSCVLCSMILQENDRHIVYYNRLWLGREPVLELQMPISPSDAVTHYLSNWYSIGTVHSDRNVCEDVGIQSDGSSIVQHVLRTELTSRCHLVLASGLDTIMPKHYNTKRSIYVDTLGSCFRIFRFDDRKTAFPFCTPISLPQHCTKVVVFTSASKILRVRNVAYSHRRLWQKPKYRKGRS